MNECVDGEYQAFKAKDGLYASGKISFGRYPELKAMVSTLTDKDIWRLNRGGHDSAYSLCCLSLSNAAHWFSNPAILAKVSM